MKLKILGFKFDGGKTPLAIRPNDLFFYMEQNCGEKYVDVYQYAAKLLTFGAQKWWGGIVIKFRDANSFTKLTEATSGEKLLTAAFLNDGEALAEVNFFLAHPDTGNGLYTHHYRSSSLEGDFGWMVKGIFNDLRKKRRDQALGAGKLTGAQTKAIDAAHRGKLILSQLVKPEHWDTLIKELKKVGAFEVALSTVITKETMFTGISARAKTQTIRYTFPADADHDALISAIAKCCENNTFKRGKVEGRDKSGAATVLDLYKNALVFDEQDYDAAMADLRIDLNDWGKSIEDASLIKKLHAIAIKPRILQLLTT